jgi:5,6-dimethylbenzimidazole synthase
MNQEFTREAVAAIYRVIRKRRDIRRFETTDVSDDIINRALSAAIHAPSVGFMQPWNFIVIRNPQIKGMVKESFLLENAAAEQRFEGKRLDLYRSLKLEGIVESPVNICVTCDHTRGGPHVLGRNSIPETDVYSVCLAVQNLWLAARAEGLGVGWVSILNVDSLRRILGIPPHITPIAYLCVGTPKEFLPEPELETAGWTGRIGLDELVFQDSWGTPRNADLPCQAT